MASTPTLSRAAVALEGLLLSEFQPPQLTPRQAHILQALLVSHGFDVTRPIEVHELPDFQGFRLTQ